MFSLDPVEIPPVMPWTAQGSFPLQTGENLLLVWGMDYHGCLFYTTEKVEPFKEPEEKDHWLAGQAEFILEMMYTEQVSDAQKELFCKSVGLPVPEPAWIRKARAAGWNPPEGWKNPTGH